MPKAKTEKIDVRIGYLIRKRREQINMSLSDLARATGTSPQMMHHYEVGNARIYVAKLMAICEALGVPPTHFLMRGGK